MLRYNHLYLIGTNFRVGNKNACLISEGIEDFCIKFSEEISTGAKIIVNLTENS